MTRICTLSVSKSTVYLESRVIGSILLHLVINEGCPEAGGGLIVGI